MILLFHPVNLMQVLQLNQDFPLDHLLIEFVQKLS